MKEKRKILYVHHVSSIGGASYCLLNIIKSLNKELYEPIVILKAIGPLADELQKIDVKVFFNKWLSAVPYNRSLFRLGSIRQIISILFSLQKNKKIINNLNVELVHINSMMLYPYARQFSRLNNKVIVHVRENWPVKGHKFQLSFARKIIDRYTNKIIAINNTSAEILDLKYKTEIIYDWIDFTDRNEIFDFINIFGNDFKKYKIFSFIGGMQKIKGALEVVKAFSQVSDQNIRLLFLGATSKEFEKKGYAAKLKQLLRFLGIPRYSDKVKSIAQTDERILFIPPNYQIKSILENSFCLLSYPKIPHAILGIAESIYLGTPVISADTPEAREYSSNGEGAILFPMKNFKEFKNSIKDILENYLSCKLKVVNARENIKENFSPEKNIHQLSILYKDLLAN